MSGGDDTGLVVVAGGTGRLGTLVVERLVARGVPVRVMTRDPGRARHLPAEVQRVVADVRNPEEVKAAVNGATTVVSAVHGFAGPGRVSPKSVDELGNGHLIDAAEEVGAAVVMVSVVGASADHPMELHRAKFAAEQSLRASGVSWTIVRSTSFAELWAEIVGRTMPKNGAALVIGRGDNPINFVAVDDVAAAVERAILDAAQRGRVVEVGGPANVTFNQFASVLGDTLGVEAKVRHAPRPLVGAVATVAGRVAPAIGRQARAGLQMDTLDLTFAGPSESATALPDALRRWATDRQARKEETPIR